MIIAHRCIAPTCRHIDVWGERKPHSVLGVSGALPTNCGQAGCCRRCQWNPQPEPVTRLDANGRPVADVLPPGSATRSYHAGSTHDCKACRDLYTHLTGGNPAAA